MGSKFVYTKHFIQRFHERNTLNIPLERMLKRADLARGGIRKHIKSNCPVNGDLANRESNNGIYVYWVYKNKKYKYWHIFVSEAESSNVYRIITYFEIDYGKIYEQKRKR